MWNDNTSVAGMLGSVTQYLPFEIAGSDPGGDRYSKPGVTIASKQSFYTNPDGDRTAGRLGQPGTQTVYGADGAAHDTTYNDYQDAKPRIVTDGATGLSTYFYYDSHGNLKWTLNALGEGTLYLYNGDVDPVDGTTLGDPALPNGLLIETFAIRQNSSITPDPVTWADNNGGSYPFTRLSDTPTSLNSYYTTTDIPNGKLANMLASTTDPSGKMTFYQYNVNGDVTRTFHLWQNPTSGQPNHWIVDTSYFDAEDRVTSTAEAIYADGGTAGILDLSASTLDLNNNLTIAETPIAPGSGAYPGLDLTGSTFTGSGSAPQRLLGTTHYNAIGQADSTTDEYGGMTYETYDARGNVIRTLYADGTETRSSYDAMGRVEWTMDRYFSGADAGSLGSPSNLIPANVTTLLTRTLYDSLGRVTGTERYENGMISIVADTDVTFSGGTGSALKAVGPDPAALQVTKNLISSTASAYDSAGRVSSSTAADGSRTLTQYYDNGQVLRTRQLPPVGDTSTGPTDWTTLDYDRVQLDVVRVVGTVSANVTYGLTLTSSGVSTAFAVTAASGDGVKEVLAKLAAAINVSGSAYRADAADGYLVLRTTTATGTFTWSSLNHVSDATHTATHGDAAHPSNSWTVDALGHVSLSEHDALTKTDTTTQFDDSTPSTPVAISTQTITGIAGQAVPGHTVGGQTIAAGGQQVTKIDAMGNATDYFYDAAGNLTDVWQPAVDYLNTTVDGSGNAVAGTSGNARPHWTYGYDADGNETSQTDALGRVTLFTFDDHDRQTSRTLPQVGAGPAATEQWIYDAFGRMYAHQDFKGQDTVEVYDTNPGHGGRVTDEYRFYGTEQGLSFATATFPLSAAAEHTSYGYDSLGRQNSVMDTTAAGTRTETTTFDPITGGVASVTTPEGVVNHTYDPATGRLLRTYTGAAGTTPSEDTRYEYDGVGRLWHVIASTQLGVAATGNATTSYAYDADGDLASVTLPSGAKTSYFYDGLNRLHEETITALDSSGTPYTAADYVYTITRADGLRDSVLEKVYTPTSGSTPFSQVSIGWQYDTLGRLVSETRDEGADGIQNGGDYAATYAFDLAGNRTKYTIDKVGTVNDDTIYSAVDARDELVAETSALSGTTSYQYDANGSLTSKQVGTNPADTYTWDLRNRMATATVGGVLTTYAYDAEGYRVKETTGGTSTRTYLKDAVNPTGYPQALEERVNGALDRAYVLGLRVEAQTDGQGMAYLLRDGHGSTRMLAGTSGHILTDGSGNPLLYAYDAFGSAIGFNAATARTTQLFGGDGEYDGAVGMTYHDARWRQGYRFVSMDSYAGQATDPISLHKYVYANADPLDNWDPSGHSDLTLTGILVATGITFALEAILSPNVANAPGPQDTVYRDRGGDMMIDAALSVPMGWVFGKLVIPALGGITKAFSREFYAIRNAWKVQAEIGIVRSGSATETAAAQQLARMEADNPGSHFFSRHGAGTTIEEQFERARSGLTPDGLQGNPSDATRFFSHSAQLDAVQQAQKIFQQTGQRVFSFDMGRIIGEGFEKGAGTYSYSVTSNVTAVFDRVTGALKTLFPLIRTLP